MREIEGTTKMCALGTPESWRPQELSQRPLMTISTHEQHLWPGKQSLCVLRIIIAHGLTEPRLCRTTPLQNHGLTEPRPYGVEWTTTNWLACCIPPMACWVEPSSTSNGSTGIVWETMSCHKSVYCGHGKPNHMLHCLPKDTHLLSSSQQHKSTIRRQTIAGENLCLLDVHQSADRQ